MRWCEKVLVRCKKCGVISDVGSPLWLMEKKKRKKEREGGGGGKKETGLPHNCTNCFDTFWSHVHLDTSCSQLTVEARKRPSGSHT